jgi:hypothetical protein
MEINISGKYVRYVYILYCLDIYLISKYMFHSS